MPTDTEIPRSLATHIEPINSIKLHSVGDVSKNGGAACVHAVVAQGSDTGLRFVAAKARMPKKELTMPRLELVVAHMAVNQVEWVTIDTTKSCE